VVSVIETHKHQGDFRELVSFARIASHSPLKGIFHDSAFIGFFPGELADYAGKTGN
jgi:hypothetical protein